MGRSYNASIAAVQGLATPASAEHSPPHTHGPSGVGARHARDIAAMGRSYDASIEAVQGLAPPASAEHSSPHAHGPSGVGARPARDIAAMGRSYDASIEAVQGLAPPASALHSSPHTHGSSGVGARHAGDIAIACSARFRFNTGGPRSRTRTQHIGATVLGTDRGNVSCPLVISLALDFGQRDPLVAVEALLRCARIREPEALRERFALPAEPCICREWRAPVPLDVADASLNEVLAQVLLLGLCTPHHFDPRRPLLLTRASLTRRLQLYAGRGFYA
jgi:hypothetical protein